MSGTVPDCNFWNCSSLMTISNMLVNSTFWRFFPKLFHGCRHCHDILLTPPGPKSLIVKKMANFYFILSMFDTLNLLWLKLLPSVLKILHITWSISKMATENQVQTKMLCSKPQHMLAHIDSPNNLKISDIFRESIWGKLLLKIPKIGPLILFLAERKPCGLILVSLALIGKGRKCIHFFFLEQHILYFRQRKDYLKLFLFQTCAKWGWRLALSWRISHRTQHLKHASNFHEIFYFCS